MLKQLDGSCYSLTFRFFTFPVPTSSANARSFSMHILTFHMLTRTYKFFPLAVNHAERFHVEYRQRESWMYLSLGWFLTLKIRGSTSRRSHLTCETRERSIETTGIRQWRINWKCKLSFHDRFSWKDLSDLGKDT